MKRALIALALATGCSHQDISGDARYFQLPDGLSEISGLAAASPGSVFAHDDERGIVYEVTLDDGRIVRRFALGNPTIDGDFEGIAADGERLWLIESDGIIRAFDAGRNGAHVPFREYDTGAGDFCEVEGLSLAPEPGKLLIVCKTLFRGVRSGVLVIYAWDTRTHEPVSQPWREVALSEALGAERDDFAPSGIEWLPDSGQILVLAARGSSLLVLDETGRITARHRINRERHTQPEGVTVIGSDRLVIADEGARSGTGQLATYPFPLS